VRKRRRPRAPIRQLSTILIAAYLVAGAVIGMAGAFVPGFVRPGGAFATFCIAVGALISAGLIWWRRDLGVRVEAILVYATVVAIGYAGLFLLVGGTARIATVLFVIDTLFGALFLGRPQVATLLGMVVVLTVWIMWASGDSWALAALHSALVLTGNVGPCLMVVALRGQLSGALERSLHQANTDPLTGLANRRAMRERLPALVSRALRGGSVVGLLMVDIDHFKVVNDTYGHQIGDEVLRDVARTIRACVRGEDLVVRVGGEEMVVVAALGSRHLVTLGERIRGDVARDCAVTVSVGVAWVEPDPEADPDEVLDLLTDAADGHLYAAKKAGRDRVSHPELAASLHVATPLADRGRNAAD
jgi:diguanylate cyclase (GGDEF)-like protein